MDVACCIEVSQDNDNIATVSVEKHATNPESSETGISQLATCPPVGLSATANARFKTTGQGATFGISGPVNVHHLVQAIRRSVGSVAQAKRRLWRLFSYKLMNSS
jgi:hypothetical protein